MKIVLIGRLVKDVEVKVVGATGKKISTFTVAENRKIKGEDTANFWDVVAGGNAGDFIAKYGKKGSAVVVTGDAYDDVYQGKNGNSVHRTKINAATVEFAPLGGGNKASTNKETAKTAPATEAQAPIADEGDDDLPF